MKKEDFYTKLANSCDLSSKGLNDQTTLKNIDGYDSLASMTMIAFIDQNFGVKLSDKEFEEVTTLYSLVEKIGLDKFQLD